MTDQLSLLTEANAPKMPSPSSATPMIAQYLRIKAEYENCLLLFRMGDFYELFFEDALTAAEILDIALTKRGVYMGEDIPMCGVPAHSYKGYAIKLTEKGFKIAICDQMEDPAEAKKRGPKAVVERAVTRIITKGTITEEELLSERAHNFIACVALEAQSERFAVAWADISTGDFYAQEENLENLNAIIERVDPKEILIKQSDFKSIESSNLLPSNFEKEKFTALDETRFHFASAQRRVETHLGASGVAQIEDVSRAALSACGVLLQYIEMMQIGAQSVLKNPQIFSDQKFAQIDAAARRNLEIFKTLSGESRFSLISEIDNCVTAAGGRLLRARLSAPLLCPKDIEPRLNLIALFQNQSDISEKTRKILRGAPDAERALKRLALGRGGPRDLASLGKALEVALQSKAALTPFKDEKSFEEIYDNLQTLDALRVEIKNALSEDSPVFAKDGGFIKTGYNAALDQARLKSKNLSKDIALLETRYRQETQIENLKIKHNRVIGYFIETPVKKAALLPPATTFN